MKEPRKSESLRSTRPPKALAEAVQRLTELGMSAGMTKTPGGEWALFVRIPAGTSIPLAEVEASAAGLPVVYEEVANLPVARPAFPPRGE